MKIITLADEMQHELANFRQEQIALVPTMGCLHEGHLSLIRQAKRLADVVVVSIYVNPLQFSQGEDLHAYPQPFADDAALCEAEGVDFIFHPQNLYPDSGMQVSLCVHDLSTKLCGAARQGHFDGVVTVVNMLFNLIQPNIAIFGEKDYQQLSIIRRMVSDLYMPIAIIEG
ncbi:MAG: pantoate--beta-alanine ligase, partial [Ghiorsea sp.]